MRKSIRAFKDDVPWIGDEVFIADTASVIGAVELAEQVSVWYGAVLRGDVGKIRVGPRTNIQDNATVHMTWEVSDAIIGADVVIGHNAVIHGATIEDEALIGIGAVVLDNVKIGKGAWIAAGSVVPAGTVIPPGRLYRGSPARDAREVRCKESEWAQGAVQRYLGLAREHLRQQQSERR